MTLCVKIADVLDITRLNRDLSTNYTEATIEVPKLSLKNLFDYTPSSDIIDKLKYKTKNNTRLKEFNNTVNDKLDVIKFLYRRNVCYKIVFKGDESIEHREFAVTNEIQFYGKMFTFNRSIENATEIKVMLGSLHKIPYKALISTPHEVRRLFLVNDTAYSDVNHYWISHLTIEKIKLPSPYETHCRAYRNFGLHDRHDCIEECVTSGILKIFGKISLFSPVTENRNQSLETFSWPHLYEDDESKKFWKIQKDCQLQQCHRKECHKTEIHTTTQPRKYTGDRRVSRNDQLGFDWYPRRQLSLIHRLVPRISFQITSRATLSFVEFVVYILGTMSTWTGLSILACNPANLVANLPKNLKTLYSRTVEKEMSSAKQRQRLFGRKDTFLDKPTRPQFKLF